MEGEMSLGVVLLGGWRSGVVVGMVGLGRLQYH